MIDSVLRTLLGHDRIVITTHIRPDGDALGSQLALGRFLEGLGKKVTLLNSDPPPYNLGWLPGADDVQVFDGSMAQRKIIDGATALVVADTNALGRLGRLAAPVQHSRALKILIDHHTEPEGWFDLSYARDTASSTGELVYEIIQYHDADLIDAEIATLLYTAIMTDTGSFRFSATTPRLHRIVADLLERGDLSPDPIHAALYDTRSMAGLRLLGRAIDTITLLHEGQVGYMTVSQPMLRDTAASIDEKEGFVNYVLSVEGVKAAVIFTEIEAGTKMSFRSKGATHVDAWARHFGGGGHRNASGAFLEKDLDVAVKEVMGAAPRFLDLDMDVEQNGGSISSEDAAYLDTLLSMKSSKSSS